MQDSTKSIDNSSSNKQIAKNAIYMYIRMAISLAIGLYTSRAILAALGAEDYGINNVVGGFVGMLSLFTVSLGGATSRFITFELGTGNKQILKDTFSTISTLILILSAIVLIIGETVGVWFVKNYLVIPEARLDAAMFSYHCSIVIFIVNLLALPYQSCVTAHEHFSFFAIVDISNSILKLLIVWLIYISPYDRLKTYAILLVVVGVSVRVIYSIYCSKHFEESKFNLGINKTIFKDIAIYSGWITIGASSAIFKEQGVNVLINIFFGVLLNAARGIAMQVYSIVNQFSSNIATAIQPQITKSYAAGNLHRSIRLTFVLAKAKGLMIMIIALPIAIEAEYILELWLGNIPDYTVIFVQWALLSCYARALEDTHGPIFLATGNVRNLQIIGGGVMLLNLPLSYLFLKLGFPAIITMQIGVIIEFVVMLIAFVYLSFMINFPVYKFYKEAIFPQMVVAIIASILPIIIQHYWTIDCFVRMAVNTVITILLVTVFGYFLVLNNQERNIVVSFIKSKVLK